MQPHLTATEVRFCRHSEPVFEPVSLRLVGGCLLIVTGKNGSGKTTLMRLLSGILAPFSGSVERSGSVSFIGHRPGIKKELSCLENLEFASRFYSRERESGGLTPHQALGKVGLGRHIRQLAGQLSAGQQRRLGLAKLLVAPTQFWLLDEPYTSLDVEGCDWVDALLEEHLSNGGGAIVSAHQRRPHLPQPMAEVVIHPWGQLA